MTVFTNAAAWNEGVHDSGTASGQQNIWRMKQTIRSVPRLEGQRLHELIQANVDLG